MTKPQFNQTLSRCVDNCITEVGKSSGCKSITDHWSGPSHCLCRKEKQAPDLGCCIRSQCSGRLLDDEYFHRFVIDCLILKPAVVLHDRRVNSTTCAKTPYPDKYHRSKPASSSTTSPSPSANPEHQRPHPTANKPSGLRTDQTAAIVIGSILGFFLLFVIAAWALHSRHRKAKLAKPESISSVSSGLEKGDSTFGKEDSQVRELPSDPQYVQADSKAVSELPTGEDGTIDILLTPSQTRRAS